MTEKASATLSGTVEMTIESIIPSEPEKAQIRRWIVEMGEVSLTGFYGRWGIGCK